MTLLPNWVSKRVCFVLSMLVASSVSGVSVAEENKLIPWEEQPQVLVNAVKSYVNAEQGDTSSPIRLGKKISILYLGFSEEEIEKNAARFPDVAGYVFEHLPYGRKKYYGYPINLTDYQSTDTIVALNFDLEREIKDWAEGREPGDTEIFEIYDPRGQYIHNLAASVYNFTLKNPGERDLIVELGQPMDSLEGAEFRHREKHFDGTCSAQPSFVAYDNNEEGVQENRMTVFSSAAPGSDEQIACLVLQTMIFVRPAEIPYEKVVEANWP